MLKVTPTTVLLVSALTGQQLEMLMVDSNFPVINASIVDPYVVLLTLNGRFLLYRVVTSPSVLLQQVKFDFFFFLKTKFQKKTCRSLSSECPILGALLIVIN